MKNKELPLYIAHRVNHNSPYKIYVLDIHPKYKDFYGDPDDIDSGFGFYIGTVQKYPNSFLASDSLAGIREKILETTFADKYGPREKENAHCSCPECGYQFEFIIRDYEGLNEEYEETVHCICGCRFRANIEQVKIIWKVEKV